MKALVDLDSKTILAVNDKEVTFWGLHEAKQSSGRAVWKDIPAGVEVEDVLVDSKGDLSADTAKIAGKDAKKSAAIARKERIKNHDAVGANSIAALRAIVIDLLAEIRGD